MRNYLYILLTLSFTILAGGRLYAQPVVMPESGTGLIDLGAKSSSWLDERGAFTVQDVAARLQDSFRLHTTELFDYGINTSRSWVRFRVYNPGPGRVYLSIGNPIADSVTLYRLLPGGPVLAGAGGLLTPVSRRQLPTENMMFELTPGADTVTWLLMVQCSRNHFYALKVGYLEDHLHTINRASTWNALFMGVALLLALYHLFLFFAIRNIPYLYYVGIVLSFGLFNAYVNGSAFLYLWPEHPSLNRLDNVTSGCAGIFSALFTIESLGLKERAPLLRRILFVTAILYALFIILGVSGFGFPAFRLIRGIVPVSLVVTIIAAAKVYADGYKPARFFLLAWSAMAVGILLFMSNCFGMGGYHFLGTHAVPLASLIEALILAFALADRFNNYRREKEQLMRTQNERLEHMVEERTAELNRKKLESDQLLRNILPEDVAAELKERGEARSRNYKAVTVLFTDFKDFTRIAEHMTPEQLVSELNYCFSAFDKITEKYGIEKIKTIGDAYMCAGGLGEGSRADARDVVRAGIEIRDFMNSHNAGGIAGGGRALEVRIGIHTGPVVAGIIGIKKFAYDIWGDTVNIASRMESAGEPGLVNISGVTYELVRDDFACRYRGRIPARNKGEIDMYFVDWKP